jgi:hypothetical protein
MSRNRIPYAMRTFIEQVKEHREDAEVEVEEPDGFGVYRRLTLDEETSNWLEPHLSVLRDNRIANHFTSRGGKAIIDFATSSLADDAARFSLPHVGRDPEPEGAFGDYNLDDQVEAVEARRKELNAIPVAQLREEYGYGDGFKKPAIIDAIIAEEFTGPDED